MHTELDRYNKITVENILAESNAIFKETNCSTLWYLSKN
jgi:hypothetical protein